MTNQLKTHLKAIKTYNEEWLEGSVVANYSSEPKDLNRYYIRAYRDSNIGFKI